MPACPLATVLYRFDDAARFPIFESHTTAKGPVTVQADRDDAGDFIRIVYQRYEADPNEVTIVLALPLVGVDGQPHQLLLDVFGDAVRRADRGSDEPTEEGGSGRVRGCHLYLEGMDASGSLLALSFGLVDFAGWRTLRADASQLVPPVQFHRLRADIAAAPTASAPFRLGVRSLSLTGEVRVAAAGIA